MRFVGYLVRKFFFLRLQISQRQCNRLSWSFGW